MNKINFIKFYLKVKKVIGKIIFPIIGLLSLIWFLIRVIPKPSRAAYPCQRAAFPFASAFVIWLTGILASSYLYVKAKRSWKQSNRYLAAGLFVLALGALGITLFQNQSILAFSYKVSNTMFGEKVPVQNEIGINNKSTVEPLSVVGIVKSPQASAFLIDSAEVQSMVDLAIERAGGFDDIITDGDTVVLKPNLIASRDYSNQPQMVLSPEANGIATDHRVIQSVVNAVREINPNGKIFLIEGSGIGSTSANMSVLLWDQVQGIDSIICLEDACVQWFDTTCNNLVGVSLPADKVLYSQGTNRYWLNNIYYNADVLISLPVLKNHFVAGFTGAIKNTGIGATPTTIYGVEPDTTIANERWTKIEHGAEYSARLPLHNWIHDYFLCRAIDFVVMDGIQGVQNGPLCHNSSSLSANQKNMRLMLASKDAVSIDAIASLLAGHDPLLVRHLVTIHNDTLGCNDPRLIRVKGIKVGDEKQNFANWNSGSYSKYSDFTPPVFNVDSSYIISNQLFLNLAVDHSVTKVEVAIDGISINQIVIDDFENCYFDLDTLSINTNTEIIVYAYDKYLNYSQFEFTGGQTSISESIKLNSLRIYPNPIKDKTNVQFKGNDNGIVTINIYSLTGQLVKSFDMYKKGLKFEKSIDLSNIEAGNYIMEVSIGNIKQSVSIIKL